MGHQYQMNVASERQTLFHKPADFDAFERIMAEAHEWVPIRIFSYAIMPNAFRFPESSGSWSK
jgi:putative transposase